MLPFDVKGELSSVARFSDVQPDRIHDFVFTTKLPTNSPMEGEVAFERKDQLGRQVFAKIHGGEQFFKTSLELYQPKVAIGVKADIYKRTLDASATAFVAATGKNGSFVLGTRGILDVNAGSLLESSISASVHDGLKSEVTVQVHGKGDSADIACSHLLRPGLTLAGMLTYTRSSSTAGGTLGIAAKIDDAISVKAKINREGIAGLSFIQNVRPNTKVIMSTGFSVVSPDVPTIGLSVSLG